MRVALFTGNYNHIRDGVSLTLNRMVRYMLNHGVEMRIYGPSIEKPAIAHEGDLIVVPSISAPGRKEYRISTGFPNRLKKDCEDFKPDLVHIATPDLLGRSALKWALKGNIPIVSSFHTNFLSYFDYYNKVQFIRPLFARYLKWFYSHCKQIYVPSESMIDELKEQMDTTNVKLWARGVELDTFNPKKRSNTWREKQGFSQNSIVITFVSRLVLEKDVDIYAKVVQQLQSKYEHVKGLVVGNGPALDQMKAILPNAVYTGTLRGDDLSTAYASSDIFLFPSISETFGNVTLEAMASGLPAFVADAPGSKSLVNAGVNGDIAIPKNVEDFIHKIEPLLLSDEKRTQFSNAARKTAEEYSWDEINNTLLQYYKQALI